jgi:Domain of unknown function (DUF6894)
MGQLAVDQLRVEGRRYSFRCARPAHFVVLDRLKCGCRRHGLGELSEMPRYYFHIDHGVYSGSSEDSFDFQDDAAARQEMIMVCSELARDVCRSLTNDCEWQIELLDETKTALFKMRLLAESLT